jgi:hypothetical protein
MASYEGEAVYSSLKVGAVLACVISAIFAIVLGVSSTEPHLELTAMGPTVSEDPDPTVIAAAVIVFGQGILLALVLWAIGTIGNHVVALRKASVPTTKEPFTRPLPTSPLGTPLPPSPLGTPTPESRPRESTYDVVLDSLGSARARHVRRLIAAHTTNWLTIGALKSPDEVLIAVGLSDVKAEALRADLEEAGASVSVEEMDRE